MICGLLTGGTLALYGFYFTGLLLLFAVFNCCMRLWPYMDPSSSFSTLSKFNFLLKFAARAPGCCLMFCFFCETGFFRWTMALVAIYFAVCLL